VVLLCDHCFHHFVGCKISPFEYEKGESTWIGQTDFKFLSSLTCIKAIIGGVMSGPKGRVLRRQRQDFYVDKDKMALLKKDAVGKRAGPTADVPFVSTNDVITSRRDHVA